MKNEWRRPRPTEEFEKIVIDVHYNYRELPSWWIALHVIVVLLRVIPYLITRTTKWKYLSESTVGKKSRNTQRRIVIGFLLTLWLQRPPAVDGHLCQTFFFFSFFGGFTDKLSSSNWRVKLNLFVVVFTCVLQCRPLDVSVRWPSAQYRIVFDQPVFGNRNRLHAF